MNETLAFPTRAMRSVWDLVVVGSRELTREVRRVSLIGEDLEGLDLRPGQQLVLTLPSSGSDPERRRYTIVGFDPDELRLDVDVPIRGDAPAARWLKSATIGDPVTAEPPPIALVRPEG